MKHAFLIASMGLALAVTPVSSQARPLSRPHVQADAAAPAKARRAALDGFKTRMTRLDALMGAAPATRARSASADH